MVSYEEMFRFVEQELAEYDAHGGMAKNKIRYSRMDHIRRVYRWMLQLYDAYPEREMIDLDALRIAVIFHDSGYGQIERGEHAKAGAGICRKFLTEHGYPAEKTEFICDMIARHSDKGLLMQDIPPELVLLLEADLLDDTGAQGVVMDVWMEAMLEEVTFESIAEHIGRYSCRLMQKNPMRTKEGKRIWEKKRALVEAFYSSYIEDLRQDERIRE